MQPNLQTPSTMALTILCALAIYMVLLGVYRRREGIRHRLKKLAVAMIGYVGAIVLLVNNGLQSPVLCVGIAVLVGLALERLLIAPRSRHIPRAERRKAIAAYERKTGKKFNSKTDELDHEIAFARFGSSTADNLRVTPRCVNRRKGKKAVWWDLLGR